MRSLKPAPDTSRSWRVLTSTALVLVAVAVFVAAFLWLFLGGSRTVVLASHDTEVRPTLDSTAVVRTGPLLPDFRLPTDGPIGVEIRLGKTEAESPEELIQRYAFIASDPTAQLAKLEGVVQDMALKAALRAAALGLAPVAVWLLLGPHRRGELFRGLRTRRGLVGFALLALLPALLWQPWESREDTQDEQRGWEPLSTFMSGLPLPEGAERIEIRTSPTTIGTKRLLQSALDTYEKSKEFYDDAQADAEALDLREPQDDETVAILVSDRHDNIGMDRVARAIGDAAGATVVLDAGDDTSTGEPWEAFSLDSLNRSFDDLERIGVAGNHDHGPFVVDYLADLGWTMLDGETVDVDGLGPVLGVHDPRSSGFGDWRDQTGLTFAEVEQRLADEACAAEERISTLLVHDTNIGSEALDRGCVDLVVGGHVHVQTGPDPVTGPDGAVGYSFTNGTTGGAAYAIAVGSKPRRDASVSLVTYRDDRPVGVQWVRLRTDGRFVVSDFEPLDLR